MKLLFKLLLGALILTVAAGAGVAVKYRDSEEGRPGGAEVRVVVPPGASGSEIAGTLEREGVVSSAAFFRAFLALRGAGADLRAGEYVLRREMGFDEVLAALRRGPADEFVNLTVPEGFTLEQAAEKVGATTHVSRDEFLQAATPATVRPALLPAEATSLEGFLYPETYRVIEREGAADLVRRMVGQFEKATAGLPWDRAASLGVTPYQALVVASLVEEESKVDEERPLVAAVVYNRLRQGIKLEIDATVQYAVKKYAGEPLTMSDLAVDSPYNTRRYPGLPPTPIAGPRLGSIRAALEPAESDALYFVLSPDCRSHVFTADYNEFLRAKERQCRGS